MRVDRLAARLVDQCEAVGESEDGHRSPTAMGVARSLDRNQPARVCTTAQTGSYQAPILNQPLQHLEAEVHPVHGDAVERAEEDGGYSLEERLSDLGAAESHAEVAEPLLRRAACQLPLHACDVQLEHHHEGERLGDRPDQAREEHAFDGRRVERRVVGRQCGKSHTKPAQTFA